MTTQAKPTPPPTPKGRPALHETEDDVSAHIAALAAGANPPKAGEPWHGYTADVLNDIAQIHEWQQAQGLGDDKFAKGAPFVGSTWSKVRRGRYAIDGKGNLANVMEQIRQHAIMLKTIRKNAGRKLKGRFVETDEWSALKKAVEAAQANAEDRDQDTIVCFVANFGCGKTTFARKIAEEYNGTIFEARPSWNEDYLAALMAIGLELGISEHNLTNRRIAETEIINLLQKRPRLLIFEECEYTGKQLLNFWKMVANQTECVQVICFITQFFDELRRRGGEYADQFLRRAIVVRAKELKTAFVKRFMTEHWPEIGKDAVDLLQRAANEKGGVHLVKGVTRYLFEELGKDTPDASAVANKIELYREQKQYGVKVTRAGMAA